MAATGSGGSDGGTGDASSGSAGAPGCMPNSCPDGEYCDPVRGCTTCADFGTFTLGEVKPLGVMPSDASATVLYPRAAQGDADLLFAQVSASAGAHVKRAMDSGGSWTVQGPIPNLDQSGASDSGPFFLADASALAGLMPPELSGAMVPVLLFHTDRGPTTRTVWGLPLMQMAMPVQLQLPGNDPWVQDITVATKVAPARLFWMHGADASSLALATATGMDSSPEDVTISLDNCEAAVQTPWVTPDGTRLLFSAKGCDNVGAHLYIAELDDEGKQKGKATRIFPGDASIDFSPSLSTDQCKLLFSRQDQNGKTALSWAKRQ